LNPLVIASSGRPFNITIGRDTNGDTLFTERPAFATDLTKPGVIVTPFGAFDPNPAAGQALIPRNYGTGPSMFIVNLGISKTFSFGSRETSAQQNRSGRGGGGGGGRGGAGGGGGRRGGGGGGGNIFGSGGGRGGGDASGGSAESRYNLTFSVNIQNLFNRTNAGTPVGNLSSSLFGESLSTAGGFGFGAGRCPNNRCVTAQVRFSF
jgi:hypothetical protein